MAANQERFSRVSDWTLALALLFAFAAHAIAYALAGKIERPALSVAPPVDMEIFEPEPLPEPEPEPEVEEPEPEPEPEPEVEPEPQPQPRERVPPEQADPEPPPPAPEVAPEPIDFGELALPGSTSIALPASERGDRTAPIGNPRPRAGRPEGEAGGTGGGGTGDGPQVVPVSNLSRRPAPPSNAEIVACLQENFPRNARIQGIEGLASVRMQVNPNGNPSGFSVRSESVRGEGFGSACIDCLRGRTWSPPLSRDGQPVATRITYNCQFTVRY